MPPIGALQQHADHLTPWLTFAGALIVALLAAVTAQLRLRTQLSAEAERLTKQLEAEEKRHLDQLSFERGETDRAELRSILDALAEHLFVMRDAAANIVTAGKNIREIQAMLDEEAMPDDNLALLNVPVDEHRARVDAEDRKVARQIQRVSLRLGPDGSRLVGLARRIWAGSLAVSLQP